MPSAKVSISNSPIGPFHDRACPLDVVAERCNALRRCRRSRPRAARPYAPSGRSAILLRLTDHAVHGQHTSAARPLQDILAMSTRSGRPAISRFPDRAHGRTCSPSRRRCGDRRAEAGSRSRPAFRNLRTARMATADAPARRAHPQEAELFHEHPAGGLPSSFMTGDAARRSVRAVRGERVVDVRRPPPPVPRSACDHWSPRREARVLQRHRARLERVDCLPHRADDGRTPLRPGSSRSRSATGASVYCRSTCLGRPKCDASTTRARARAGTRWSGSARIRTSPTTPFSTGTL